MHSLETVVATKVLARQGNTIRQIPRELGVSRNTVRRYLRDDMVVGSAARAAHTRAMIRQSTATASLGCGVRSTSGSTFGV
jgi:predicted transcriptional regulator